MNTIIINKILVHMIDFEHRKIHLSKDFASINDTTHDYYHKKLEKALYSAHLKQHHAILCPSISSSINPFRNVAILCPIFLHTERI